MMRLGLLISCLFVPRAVPAQNLVAQAVGREAEEYVDGALANLALRTPVVAPAWRRPVVRAALFLGASGLYETLIDPMRSQTGHEAWADWGDRAMGYVITELVIGAWQALRR